jgi:hypothetical protein
MAEWELRWQSHVFSEYENRIPGILETEIRLLETGKKFIESKAS